MTMLRDLASSRVAAGAVFALASTVPIGIVVFSFGYAQYLEDIERGPELIPTAHDFARLYLPLVYLPALVVVTVLVWSARRTPMARRLAVGAAAGAIATVALDAIRQMGVIHGWLPGDTPTMFGKAVTGSMSFAVYWPTGLAIHVLNGAGFGVFYAFVWGKRRSWQSALGWGCAWAVLIEMGMMTLPPMAPMTGAFGVDFAWPQMFLITLAAHLAFGATLGLLAQAWLRASESGSFLPAVRRPAAKSVQPARDQKSEEHLIA